jgi:PAS domain S-box-containing protein
MSYTVEEIVPYILISIGVVFLSSYTSFLIIERVKPTLDWNRIKGVIFAAITMGIGIWSMHFIWILGYNFHANVVFDTFLTGLTLIIAIISSLLAFYLMYLPKYKSIYLSISSLIIGIGIALMHFIGMSAMHMQVEYYYETPLVVVSILIGIISSFFSFLVFNKTNSINKIGLSAMIFAVGVSLKHYIAMKALVITRHTVEEQTQRLTFDFTPAMISADTLAYGVGFTTLFIVSVIILIAFRDKKVAEKKRMITEEHYRSLVQHSPLLIMSLNTEYIITSVNPSGLNLLNKEKENVEAVSVVEFIQKDEQKKVIESIEACKFGKPIEINASIVNSKNEYIPMVLTIIPNIVDNQYLGAFIKGRDISKEIEYQARIIKAQKDLSETIRKQQGMTFKYIKFRGEFIHTLCDGELLGKLGFKPNRVVGKSLYSILPKAEADRKRGYYEKAWLGQKTSYEGTVNGVEYLAHLTPVFEDGVVKEVIGSSIEITEKKNAEQKLKKEKDFYQNILNTMSEAILIYSPNDEISIINDKVYKMFGVSNEGIARLFSAKSTIEIVEEDGSIFASSTCPVSYERISKERFNGKVLGIKIRNTEMRWLSINTQFLEYDLEQAKPSILISISDITHLKRQEVLLREVNALRETILNNLHVGILFTDLNQKTLLNNKQFAAMFDFKESEINDTDNYVDLYFKDPKHANQVIEEIMKKSQRYQDEIETFDHRHLIRNYIPFYMEGNLKGHLWTFEDITERKRLEKDILKTREEAIKANEAKSEFLSKMSHELRTPLNAVLGFSQLLELDHSLNSKQKSFILEILKGGQHLLELINEVLDLSRIESGKLKITYENVSLSRVIEECIQLIQPIADSYHIHIISELTDCYVLGDELRIKQIILNLLDNAIKYNIENGSIHIRSYIKNGNVIISIHDTGIGISSEEQKRIFEPFYRINEKKVQGTGIGLSIVRQLVSLMNGNIDFTSKKDEGTEFWISMPIVKQHYVSDLSRENHIQEYLMNDRLKKILYIEDHASNLQLVELVLKQQLNITLETAETGEEGIELIRKDNYDLILLDINLPGINGFEVLEEIRNTDQLKDIPVIALSANAMESFVEYAKDSGFTDFITKPIHIPSFLKTIRNYI